MMMNARKWTKGALVAFAAVTISGTALAEPKAPVRIPPPPAGKGQIVFYRTGTIMGAAMGCSVRRNAIGPVQDQDGDHGRSPRSSAVDSS